MSNPTNPKFKYDVADAVKATKGSQKNDRYDESLRETIRAGVIKRRYVVWLTYVIRKTAITLAHRTNIEDHNNALSRAMKNRGFTQESIINQKLRASILNITITRKRVNSK